MATTPAAGARRYPGFGTLRIAAALAVVVEHAYSLTGRRVPSFALGEYKVSPGYAGVLTFFVISGFLVTTSWTRNPDARSFATKRFLRIWPALTTVVIAAAFVVGPIATTVPLGEYLRHASTRGYVLRNLLIPFTTTQYPLSGVFRDLPTPGVNGSLWTLRYEVLAYLALMILAVVGLLRRRAVVFALFAIALVVLRLGAAASVLDIGYGAFGVSVTQLVRLGTWFLAGVGLSHLAGRLTDHRALPAAAIATAVAVALGEALLFVPAASVLVVTAGMWRPPWSERLHAVGDPSYGIYLYSFPIQQLVVWGGLVSSPASLFLVATPLSFVAGYASWYGIERPAMRLAHRPRVTDSGEVTAAASDVAAVAPVVRGARPGR